MFSTDLSLDCEAAVSLGLDPEDFYAAGIEGALCDEETKARLREIGAAFDWSTRPPATLGLPAMAVNSILSTGQFRRTHGQGPRVLTTAPQAAP